MLDSVQRFASMFADQSHLYVLGSMKEMGPESEYWHRQTAETMNLQSGADVYLVGEEAPAMAEGLKARGISSALIHIVANSEDLAPKLRAFDGAVFLKGSRSYGLESLLPNGGQRC
jgi:UDP-N-acetylmuramoyl-tripeptide--D-alanyl-D-alanine ligase